MGGVDVSWDAAGFRVALWLATPSWGDFTAPLRRPEAIESTPSGA
jgi:hypothetical protein